MGLRGPGGFGNKFENVTFFYIFVYIFEKMKTITKYVNFARIGIISIQNKSPHRVLDSSEVFGQYVKEDAENQNSILHFSFFPNVSQQVPIQTAGPHLLFELWH